MKEAALQGQTHPVNGVRAGYSTGATMAPVVPVDPVGGYYGGSPGQDVPLAQGGGSDSDEPQRRQKRKRQSTKKGNMTATEEELAELDEGMEDEEPVSWKKTTGQRGRSGIFQIQVSPELLS